MRRLILILPILGLLTACAGPAELGFSQQEWQAMTPQKRQQLSAQYRALDAMGYKPGTTYAGPEIHVYLMHGKAAMPPFIEKYSFEATEFSIKPGKCEHLRLNSVDSHNSVLLRACYDGLHLSLDPSRYDEDKKVGTVHFAYNPLWQTGFTYSDVTSSGYVNLEDATVTIKATTTAP